MASGKNDPAALEATNAAAGTAKIAAAALAHLHKDQGAVGISHDQIDLAAASARGAKIRLDPAQALALKEGAGRGLGPVALPLGGNLLAAGSDLTLLSRSELLSGTPH
jgi:hypothetical protein